MSIVQVLSLVQFARGTSLVWDALATPLPAGVVAFSIDDGVFKLGDGVNPFSSLPILFSYTDLISAQGGVSGLFNEPTVADNGKIVVVAFDAGTGTMKYSVSNTTLSSLLSQISTLEAGNTAQDAAIAQLLSKALSIDVSINTGLDNEVVVVNNGRFTSSGTTIAGVQSQIEAGIEYTPGSHLEEPVFYTTVTKAKKANKLKMYDGSTYYVDIIGFNNNVAEPVYGLTSDNTGVIITNVSGSLFSVRFSGVCDTTKTDTPVVLVASIDNIAGTSKVQKAIACLVLRNRILVSIYGGTGADKFNDVCIDKLGNIFAVGETASEGKGGTDALIVKFDSNLNILAKKRYGGTYDDSFMSCAVDSQNNVFCVGYTYSEGYSIPTFADAMIIKFDNNLNLLIQRRCAVSYMDALFAVTVDSKDNVICAGQYYSQEDNPVAYNVFVIKLTNNLVGLYQKAYGSVGVHDYSYGIITDTNDNIFVCGSTSSEGVGSPTYSNAFVMKLDSSLNKLVHKLYGGSNAEEIYDIAIDSNNNIIVVGMTASEGVGTTSGLIIKYDNNLNILAKKYYGGSLVDYLYGVTVDSENNIIVTGNTNSEGVGSYDAILLKINSDLNVVFKKRYGGSGDENFSKAKIDAEGNTICVGNTNSEGAGSTDALIVKFPKNIPSGTITGTALSGLTYADSTLTLADSNLTSADSVIALTAPAMNVVDFTLLTLATSFLTQEFDILN